MAAPVSSKNSILAAAIEILHSEGAGALTVRSVAKAAGCSTTGVYTWFGGKNGLVEAIFIDGFARFGNALVRARKKGGVEGSPRGLAQAYRKWALANPTHYMVMFGRAVPDFRPSADALIQARATFEHLVQSTSELMQSSGVSGSPLEVAYHVWAGIHGYVSLELAGMDMAENTAERARRFAEGMRRLHKAWLEPT